MKRIITVLFALLLALPTAIALPLPLYVNAGSQCFSQTTGQLWMSDEIFVNEGQIKRYRGTDIAATDDIGLYREERFFRHYEFAHYYLPIPYGITEVHVTESKSRWSQEFNQTVFVSDGVLDISLPRVVQNPKINGIKVVRLGTAAPSPMPSLVPSALPSSDPSSVPSSIPSSAPSSFPSNCPSMIASDAPSGIPTNTPSSAPSDSPTVKPSSIPTVSIAPSVAPNMSHSPSHTPSRVWSSVPTGSPSTAPSSATTSTPSSTPSSAPSLHPSLVPSRAPTSVPSSVSSNVPSTVPSSIPSPALSESVTSRPTQIVATNIPTDAPIENPTLAPTGLIVLNLIHSPSNAILLELTDGAIVDMKDYGVSPEFNVEAVEQNKSVVRINFVETNKSEGVKPFSFCGDNGGDYNVCPTLSFGMNIVTAEGINSSGQKIGQVKVTFEIVDTSPSRPSPPNAQLAPAPVPRWIETDPNANIDERHENCFVMVDNPVAGRKAYLVGGRGNKALDILDPVTRTWSSGLEPPIQMHHMQCVAAQGLLWVVSPWTDWYPKESNVDSIYVYDPATNKWSTKAGLPPSRQRGGAAVIVSNDESKIYVSHGNNGGHETQGSNHAESLGYLDEFDIATETWTALSNEAPNPRDHTGGAMINGRICVAGGRNGGLVNWPEVAPTDCYDLSTGTWSVEAPIPQVRGGSAYGQTCDGKLMVAGGEGSGKAWDNVDVFDGTSWTTIESLNIGRHGTGLAFDCVCDHIIIASGAAAQGGGPEITSVETYVPAGVNPQCLA